LGISRTPLPEAEKAIAAIRGGQVPDPDPTTSTRNRADLLGLTIQSYSGHMRIDHRLTKPETYESKRMKADRQVVRSAMIYVATINLCDVMNSSRTGRLDAKVREDGWKDIMLETILTLTPEQFPFRNLTFFEAMCKGGRQVVSLRARMCTISLGTSPAIRACSCEAL
jgi:hypothetical protein